MDIAYADSDCSLERWRLFIDSSNKSFIKAVLLYNGNRVYSIPVTYS